MAVRETLELDIRRALAQAREVGAAYEKALKDAGKALEAGLHVGAVRAQASEFDELAAATRRVGSAGVEAAAGIDRHRQSQELSEQAARRHTLTLADQQRALQGIGFAATAAGAALGAGIGLGIHAMTSFEAQMSLVAAVSGATGRQMDALRAAAIRLGQDTFFTATEAAAAETELAKAGVSVQQILSGGLASALALATAGQLDLARAAEIVAQAMMIFGLSGKDTGRVADALAAGANKSTASVASLAEGLGNVGGVAARLFNMTLEETVGVLAMFDQNALRGAEGGTALRAALLALASPSKQQREAMQALGFSIYDASGRFVGLAEMAGRLQAALAGASEEQRNFALATIFGTYGIRAANILVREGEAGVRKWTKAVTDQGAAARFSQVAMDNLAGDIEQLRGSIETTLIVAASQGNDVLRFLAKRATEAFNGISSLPGPVQAAGFGLTALASATLLGVGAFSLILPRWQAAIAALEQMGTVGQFAARNLGGMLRVAGGLAAALVSFQMIGQTAEATATGILGLTAAGATVGSVFGPYGTAIGAAAGATVGFAKALIGGGESAEEFRGRIARLASAMDSLGERAALRAFLDSLGFDALRLLRGDVDAAMRAFNELARTSPANAAKVVAALRNLRDETGRPLLAEPDIERLERALARGEVAYARAAQTARETRDANLALADATAAAGTSATAAEEAWNKYVDGLSAGVPTIAGLFDEAVNAVKRWQDANSPEQLLFLLGMQIAAVENFTANVRFLMEQGLDDLAAVVAQKGPIAGGQLAQALRDASPETLRALEETLERGSAAIGDWAAWIGGPGAEMMRSSGFAAGYGAGDGVGAGLGAASPRVSLETIALAAQVGEAFGTMPGVGYDAGRRTGEGFRQGLADSSPSVWEGAAGLARGVVDAIRRALSFGSPSRVTREFGRLAGEGFALGIADTEEMVALAGQRLAVRAVPGIRAAGAGGMARGGGSVAAPSTYSTTIGPITVNGSADPAAIAREIAWRQRLGR